MRTGETEGACKDNQRDGREFFKAGAQQDQRANDTKGNGNAAAKIKPLAEKNDRQQDDPHGRGELDGKDVRQRQIGNTEVPRIARGETETVAQNMQLQVTGSD